jgi:hypothetical protein
MNILRVSTNGLKIHQGPSLISTHPILDIPMALFDLHIGDTMFSISFESGSEMIRFCEDHNFIYEDVRSGVQKYLDDLEDYHHKRDEIPAF